MSFRAYRVFLDANVWYKYLVAQRRGHAASTVSRLVDLLQPRSGQTLQIIVSHELLDTLGDVLSREGVLAGLTRAFLESLAALSAAGPESQFPFLTFGGRDELAMRDRKDAGIMACCIGAGVDLLVTDSLRDFVTNDTERFDTQRVKRATGGERQLFALTFERGDDVSLVVLHPFDRLVCTQRATERCPSARSLFLSVGIEAVPFWASSTQASQLAAEPSLIRFSPAKSWTR